MERLLGWGFLICRGPQMSWPGLCLPCCRIAPACFLLPPAAKRHPVIGKGKKKGKEKKTVKPQSASSRTSSLLSILPSRTLRAPATYLPMSRCIISPFPMLGTPIRRTDEKELRVTASQVDLHQAAASSNQAQERNQRVSE